METDKLLSSDEDSTFLKSLINSIVFDLNSSLGIILRFTQDLVSELSESDEYYNELKIIE